MNTRLKIDPLLLNLLCCPSCKGDSSLTPDNDVKYLICSSCNRQFSLKEAAGPDGKGVHIPGLLINDQD